MPSRTERLQQILADPLGYIHPQRLSVPAMLDTPAARRVLGDILFEGLWPGQRAEDIVRSALIDLWIDNWSLLPRVALLMGVQASWPHLARGAVMRQLDPDARAFGACSVAPRLETLALPDGDIAEVLVALGLGKLLAWRPHLPQGLIEPLLLQFPPQVVELQRRLPASTPDAALLTLAIQHARIHPNPH